MRLVRIMWAATIALGLAGLQPSTAAQPKSREVSTTLLRSLGGEPNVVTSPDGRTVLVTAIAEAPAVFYRSTDSGRTFTRISPKFTAAGGQDIDLVFLDNTTVVAADLSLGGQGILVHRSTDRGSTWTTTSINTDVYDRPWIGHVGQTVHIASRGFDQVPYLFTSTDGGRTFGLPTPVVGPVPENPAATPAGATVVQHLAVAPNNGDVYVLQAIQGGGTYVSRRTPDGATPFESHLVTAASGDNGFNWMTVDRAGHVYVLMHETRSGVEGSWLYASRDRGVTWTRGVEIGGGDFTATAFGAISGGAPGRLSLTYLAGTKNTTDTAQDWYVEVATVLAADTPRPRVVRLRPLRRPVHQGNICSKGIACGPGESRNLLDYISTAQTPGGIGYAVVASDGPATGNGPTDAFGKLGGVIVRWTLAR